MPFVVPELKTITLGGAVTGVGIESSSFRYGCRTSRSSRWTSSPATARSSSLGRRATTRPVPRRSPTPTARSGMHCSSHRARARAPVRALRHVRFDDVDRRQDAIGEICARRSCDGEPVDFLDGVWFSARRGLSDARPWAELRCGTAHPSDYIGDGLLPVAPAARAGRGSPSTTTCGGGTPTGSGARGRSVRSSRWSAGSGRSASCAPTSSGSSSPSRRYDVKAGSTPARGKPASSTSCRTSRFRRPDGGVPRRFLREVPIDPCGCARSSCATRARHDAGRPVATLPDGAGPALRQRRFLVHRGRSSRARGRRRNRAIEDEVGRLGGHKSLYSDAFYSNDVRPPLRWRRVRPVKKRYDPGDGSPLSTKDGAKRDLSGGAPSAREAP